MFRSCPFSSFILALLVSFDVLILQCLSSSRYPPLVMERELDKHCNISTSKLTSKARMKDENGQERNIYNRTWARAMGGILFFYSQRNPRSVRLPYPPGKVVFVHSKVLSTSKGKAGRLA